MSHVNKVVIDKDMLNWLSCISWIELVLITNVQGHIEKRQMKRYERYICDKSLINKEIS